MGIPNPYQCSFGGIVRKFYIAIMLMNIGAVFVKFIIFCSFYST
ncbi:hypothetical protein Brsp04_04247 [Brucella sp. NBRC 12952]|uniref:Putative membrane protein n=1 Tax=Brucella pseudogrignonensis TaxID=419475 RepID=A0A256G1M6_9HYPH|nr:putative membrane protein [Brucella pseudogrignonensis]